MAASKFSRGNRAARTAAERAPRRKTSRYAGAQSSAPRDPMPTVGSYRFRVVGTETGSNPGKGTESFKAKLEVVQSEGDQALAPDTTCVFLQLLTGKAGPAGISRVKRFAMFAAGFDNDADYDAWDPDGEFLDSLEEVGDVEGGLNGRLVECDVSRGNDVTKNGVPTGDYYREYTWYVVPEQEQDVQLGAPEDAIA